MTDTAKWNAVRAEFYGQAAATGARHTHLHVLVADNMTSEIVRLRDRLAAVEAERDDAIIDKRISDEQRAKWMAENVALLHRADRGERILAALREPSEAVVKTVWENIVSRGVTRIHDMKDTIRAAVAAAEQELGG